MIFLLVNPKLGFKSVEITFINIKEMLLVIPPIFILLGLLDTWISKETMIKYMGEGSKITGSLIAFLLGAVAAGPLYAAFPVAGVFIKKGVKLFNVFLFIGAWSVSKIPLLLFEATSLGIKYMAIRFIFNVIGIIIIAYLLSKSITKQDEDMIKEIANQN
jgi:uncharacterized membrane protein YraQ (UPF0718 family)